LPYAEFSYNNSYQASLGMSPFEALYGRKCKTPLMWSEVGERALIGPALIKEAEEKVAEVREKLKSAQSRQKNYADRKRREISFNPGDFVYLKVSPIRGTRRFSGARKIGPSIHWTVSSSKESRSSSIPTGVTRRNVGYTSSVSRLATKEMFESTRG
jgi:hypothetical protein